MNKWIVIPASIINVYDYDYMAMIIWFSAKHGYLTLVIQFIFVLPSYTTGKALADRSSFVAFMAL